MSQTANSKNTGYLYGKMAITMYISLYSDSCPLQKDKVMF